MAIPAYTSWIGHGTVCPTPPVSFIDTHAYAFGVNASVPAMQALVDKLLMPSAQGKVTYTVPAGGALITFNDVERCASTVDEVGWMPGRESAIWILLVETRETLPFMRPVLWAPYIFIDTDLGMVPGREIWGWPKSIGHVGVATDWPTEPARFVVQTNVFKVFDPSQRGESAQLLTVTGTKPLTLPAAAPTWTSGASVFWSIATILLKDAEAEVAALLALKPVLPAIALKQFRDSDDPSNLCYRALVNAPCRCTKFTSGSILDDKFTVSIKTCASHAIVADIFGVPPGPDTTEIPVVWAAALEFDFLAENGTTILPPG